MAPPSRAANSKKRKCCPTGSKPGRENVSQLIFFFFAASVGGFLWEVLIFLIKENKFRNRGFLYGPWLPVYGVGAVLFYILLRKQEKRPFAVFFLSTAIGTGLELLIGWLLHMAWGLRYWDYTGSPLNLKGYICLWSALGFGIAGTFWVCFFSGFLARLWMLIPERLRRGGNTLLLLLFLVDCTAALIFPNTGKGITFS